MYKSYLKIAWRNLARNRSYTFINIVGLAIGLACCILITMYVVHELSYDKFHAKSDRLYRVTETYSGGEQPARYATTYSALAPLIQQEFSAVRNTTHVYPTSGLLIGPDNKRYQQEDIILADSAFFEMFSFPLIQGEAASALLKPFTMVITESAAARFFGDTNPVGESITFKDSRDSFDFEITGVAEDPPDNSHLQFGYVLAYESLRTMRPWEYGVWYYPPMYTYVELVSPDAKQDVEGGFPSMYQKYRGDQAAAYALGLQPITDIRLNSDLQNEPVPTSDITYIYLFSLVAVFILVIACINFMNLATARSMKRAREVGMRKTLGAGRRQLIGQFLSEAMILTAISLALAVIIVEAVLPYFNTIAGKTLITAVLYRWEILVVLIGVILFVGLLAGSYPAFYLSSFKPVEVLKGKVKAGRSSARFRKALVVFQFVVSTGLILGTLVIMQQLDYIQNEKLGFDKEQVLLIPVRETADQFNLNALKQQVLTLAGVEHASAVSGVPGISGGIHGFNVVPANGRSDTLNMLTLTVDHDYVQTLGLDLQDGRNFSEEYPTDEQQAFIINRAAARNLGWDEPVGKELTLQFYVMDLIEKKGRVVGVVDNFQYHSLHQSMDPVLLQVFSSTFYHDYLAVRFGSGDVQQTVQALEAEWKSFNSDRPFEYFFLDEAFDAMYRSEQRLSQIFNAFAVLAVLIACLGLFGLASYSTEQRVQEIGIRKVLGAGLPDILGLLSKDFLKLVLLGFVLSVPIAWYLIRQWLENYAEQVGVHFGIVFTVGAVAVAVAIIAVSYQTIRAALMDPVQSLRSE